MLLADLREKVIEIGLQMLQDRLVHHGQCNISARDRESGYIAITPSGLPYHRRQAEDICVIDIDQHIIEGRWRPTSEIGLHIVFYRNRKDVNAVIHTHAPYTTIYSIIGEKSLPMVLNESAMCLGRPLPVTPYGRPGSLELAQITYDNIGNGIGAIMAHHGLVTMGATLERAYDATLAAEATAHAIIMARAIGATIHTLAPEEISYLQNAYRIYSALPAEDMSAKLIYHVKAALIECLGNQVDTALLDAVVAEAVKEVLFS
jgi:ribulose-5-phosphate 4-epimerase/fuculose-1-phosphate aldolase